MGRSVYLFELSKYDCNKLQLAKKLLSLDYNVIKDENEWGVIFRKNIRIWHNRSAYKRKEKLFQSRKT